MSHRVHRCPVKLGVDRLHWLILRDFFEKTDYQFLYLTENDALHDSRFVERLAMLYDSSRLPVCLYNSPVHEAQKWTLLRKEDYWLRRAGTGLSMLLTRPMVGKILAGLRHDLENPELAWDLACCQQLGLPWAISAPSFVEHLGAGGLHSVDYEGDRALAPSQELVEMRAALLETLPKPKRIISFSLWGTMAKYGTGALANARLAIEIYPGWTCRFYHDDTVPTEVLCELTELGAELVAMPRGAGWQGLFWRFQAACDPTVDVMISRDCDSRLGRREAEAVNEWLQSGAPFHIMRDHPYHATAIPAGMWGCRRPHLDWLGEHLRSVPINCGNESDQDFLRDVVFPHVSTQAWVHDEFFQGVPFPTPRQGLQFVGESFDEQGRSVEAHVRALSEALCRRAETS